MTGALADLTDGELAALSLTGRNDAFAHIVRRHKEPLYRLVVRMIGDDHDALDVVQEAFVSAHRALGDYDQERPIRAWLSRIAINKARDWQRRRTVRRWISAILPIDQATEVAEEAPSIETQAADRQEMRRVSDAIAALPGNLREVLVLRTIEELSQKETAQMLGISEKAVETRLYRARRKLAEQIDQQ